MVGSLASSHATITPHSLSFPTEQEVMCAGAVWLWEAAAQDGLELNSALCSLLPSSSPTHILPRSLERRFIFFLSPPSA